MDGEILSVNASQAPLSPLEMWLVSCLPGSAMPASFLGSLGLLSLAVPWQGWWHPSLGGFWV